MEPDWNAADSPAGHPADRTRVGGVARPLLFRPGMKTCEHQATLATLERTWSELEARRVQLTPAEWTEAACLALGIGCDLAAAVTGRSVHTVRQRRRRVERKLQQAGARLG
jgi:hypothetical protein